MKKLLMLGAVALLVVLPYANVAGANDPIGALETGTHNSAGVAKGFLCGTGPGGLTTQSHATISNSGNETLFCQGQLATPPPQAIRVNGLLCGLFFGGLTTNSRLVITAGGPVNLVCKS